MELKHTEVINILVTDKSGAKLATVFLPDPLKVKKKYKMKTHVFFKPEDGGTEKHEELMKTINEYVTKKYVEPKLTGML